MATLTIKLPQIDGISPMELKKDIDYLICRELKKKYDGDVLKTEVLVASEKPDKVFRSQNYRVVTGVNVTSGDVTFIEGDVTVDYPEQTYVEVILEGCTGHFDVIKLIKSEIEAYLCLYRVKVINNTISAANSEPEPTGLELTACIPQLDTTSRLKLKKEIDHIIKKVGAHSQSEEVSEQPTAPAKHLKYGVEITDSVNDKKSFSLVNVKLEGEADKEYYETMWDINRKIKTYSK